MRSSSFLRSDAWRRSSREEQRGAPPRETREMRPGPPAGEEERSSTPVRAEEEEEEERSSTPARAEEEEEEEEEDEQTSSCDGGRRKAEVFRERFFVSLADNIERRLDDNGIISAAAALNPSNWPSDEDERILYGDEKLLAIHKTLAVEAATSPILLKEFHEFKCHGVTGESMRKVLTAVSTLPVSTAEPQSNVLGAERGRQTAMLWPQDALPGSTLDLRQGRTSAFDTPATKTSSPDDEEPVAPV
ncbi:unnamed protein product [Arctogadus glacialis]